MGNKLGKPVKRMLAALSLPGVVVDSSLRVVGASATARSAGLVRKHRLTDSRLAELAARARAAGSAASEPISLPRPVPGGPPLELVVRAARIDHRHTVLLAEDRSAQRRIEAVRRDFLANISHELKTPIAAVGLLAEALQVAAEDPDQVRAFSGQLVAESQRLAQLVQDVIELSRLEAAEPGTHATLCRVADIIRESVEPHRVAAQARHIEITLEPTCEAMVYGDERVLTMAVQNLLANAVQFSHPGDRVRVGAVASDGVVAISVSDTGEGIPADKLPRVFERFYRIDKARSRDTGGTGLGLAIVKHAASTHGGDVQAVSQPGAGSTFTLRLPEAEPDDEGDDEADAEGLRRGPAGGTR